MLYDKSIKEYLNETASKHPIVPSGGSVLALCSALSSTLGELVANVTIDKKGYEDVWSDMKQCSQELYELRRASTYDIDKDAKVYNDVISAFKLPKGSDDELIKRNKEIQNCFIKATLVPVELAERTMKILNIIMEILNKGNKNASGDAYAAALIAEAVIKGSLNNGKHNLEWVKNEEFIKETNIRIENIKKELVGMSKYSI